MVGANFDYLESHEAVVAGLVAATPNIGHNAKIIGVAGTSPATTRGEAVQ
jgi:hypothetical protein